MILSNGPIPMLYSSTAIPAIMIVLSILWLTVVESRVPSYTAWVGFLYMTCIVVQPLVQLGFLVYANKKFTDASIKSLNNVVWAVFALYAATNVYFFPTMYKYVKLRKREFYQGLDQGLLTSERNPQSTRTMDVYLEDAFAIDDDINQDRITYTKTDYGGTDEGNVVEFDFLSKQRASSSEPQPHDVFT
uniref:Uncharacterized protein n=3 Tax=Ciona intestinalis TaxID=7719 RepID=F6Z9N8_CIOIN